MKSVKIAKINILLITALIFSVIFANQAFAAVKWLSSITNVEAPARIALDGKGNIYVTEPVEKNRVKVFDRQGAYLRTLGGLKQPKGIAVDVNGKIYVGNVDTGSVDVYNQDFTPAMKLGAGKGEFEYPSSITVTSTGMIYVADTNANLVKVYNPDGSRAFSFGNQSGAILSGPLGLALDEARGEIYVTDQPLITITDPNDQKTKQVGGARVQAFTMNGAAIRSFGNYGSGPGQMKMPMGIAADGAGKLFITDPSLATVLIFDINGSWIENISDGPALRTPAGIAVGKDKRLFVVSSLTPSIEVYGLPGYTTISINQKSLSFTSIEGGANPAAQAVAISNSGSGTINWSAKAATADGNAWLSVPAVGSTGPGSSSALSVSADSKTLGLRSGAYSGTVIITTDSGMEETVSVTLAVSPPPMILNVVPAALSFKAQQGGAAPHPQSFSVTNAGSGNMAWSAATATSWLKLTADSQFLTVSPDTGALAAGSYNNNVVTITATGAAGSPTNVSVSVEIVLAGTLKVTSNIATAAFDIAGPATYSNTGLSWSRDNLTPGDYTITFKHVPGYLKPVARKFTIMTGQEIEISGIYRKKPAASHVIAGSVKGNCQVSVQPLNGDPARSFSPFADGVCTARVAAGDLDASGIDKIVVTDDKRTIKVFSDQGALVASHDLPEGYRDADVVVADLDNDGKAEILVPVENESQPRRAIKIFTYSANALQERTAVFTENREGAFSIALGDVNGDGALELLLADSDSIRAFAIQQSPGGVTLSQLWIKNGDYGNAPRIASGDLNGDGIYEIAVSYDHAKESRGRRRTKEQASLISILKGTGEDYGLTIEPFKDLGYTKPATIAIGDIDGDLADELVAGAGPSEDNDPLIRTFESDGTYAGVTMKPMNGKFGVNVGLGTFQQ